MVVRHADLPTPLALSARSAPGSTAIFAGTDAARLAHRGQLMLERASSLDGVRAGGRGNFPIEGVPLYLDAHRCQQMSGLFLRGRIFAVIADDGALCLRAPADIETDLISNGLCVKAGKTMLTWPVTSERLLEINWRILLHLYWEITGTPRSHARRLWSEWVIHH